MSSSPDHITIDELVASIVAEVSNPETAKVYARRLISDAAARAELYRHAIRPIWGANNSGMPEHIGSCILLEISSKRYVLTAAHVVDWASSTSLYIGLADLELLQVKFICSESPSDNRADDLVDYAIALFPDQLNDKLGDAVFIEESSIGIYSPTEDRYFTCLGYPNSKNLTPKSDANVVRGELQSYTSRGRSCSVFPARAQNHVHILVDRRKYSRDDDGNKVSSLKANGFSGGAIFDVGALGTFLNAAYPSKAMLSAMLIEYHSAKSVLIGVRIDYIIGELRSKGIV